MQRARRLASTAVVAVMAVTGLSACRSEPGVAAYVGETKIMESKVEALYADAETKLADAVTKARAAQQANPDPNQQPVPDDVKLGLTPGDVLEALVGVEVLSTIAEQRNVQPTEVPVAQIAQQVGLPPEIEYLAVFAKYQGYLSALSATAKPVELTEAQKRDVYTRLRSAGGSAAEMSYEDFTTTVLTAESTKLLQQSYGLRADLSDAAQKLDATVNPRYGTQELPLLPIPTQLGGTVTLVGLPFGSRADVSPVVVDQS